MKNKESKQCRMTTCLFLVYLIVLTWIILFKMGFSIQELGHFRGINLIPFHGSAIVNNKIDFSEIYANVLVFVPFGLYISMLKSNWPFLKKVLPIAGVSLLYEVFQFILVIGASDITDFIGNTLGGIIGIGIYFVIRKMFKTENQINKVLNIIALIATICILTFLLFLTLANA